MILTKINARDIEKILPEKLRRVCQVGICNPLYLERKKSVFCRIPIKYGGPRWSARPRDVLPSVKSIIVLIYFTPIAQDYFVENIILTVADILWRRLRIKTHVLDKLGIPSKENFVGKELSFLESTGYDAKKKMVLFKDIAYYAGLGQYGKNSLIINNRFGSDIKIQALFTEIELEYNKPILPKAYSACKDCYICVKSCPVQAIYNYKFISSKDVCRLVINDGPAIISRLPKKDIRVNTSVKQRTAHCRICQSFCPVNAQHYVRNSLIFARKKKQGKIVFLYSTDSGSG
jgi:epoxyqueuosine reductase